MLYPVINCKERGCKRENHRSYSIEPSADKKYLPLCFTGSVMTLFCGADQIAALRGECAYIASGGFRGRFCVPI